MWETSWTHPFLACVFPTSLVISTKYPPLPVYTEALLVLCILGIGGDHSGLTSNPHLCSKTRLVLVYLTGLSPLVSKIFQTLVYFAQNTIHYSCSVGGDIWRFVMIGWKWVFHPIPLESILTDPLWNILIPIRHNWLYGDIYNNW